MALLLNVLLNVLILLVFLRFLMQLAGINFFNPVVQSTVKATQFVDVLNRSLPKPAKGRINLAAIILLILLYLVKVSVLSNMAGGITIFDAHYKNLASGADSFLLGTLMAVTDGVLTFCRYLIFAAIIMSWVTLFTQKSIDYPWCGDDECVSCGDRWLSLSSKIFQSTDKKPTLNKASVFYILDSHMKRFRTNSQECPRINAIHWCRQCKLHHIRHLHGSKSGEHASLHLWQNHFVRCILLG